MPDAMVVRSIVSRVWYPQVASLTGDALDAVIDSVVEGQTSPPLFPDDDHSRQSNWVDTVKLIFDAAAFVKTCIDIYNLAPTYEEARVKVEAASAGVSEAIKSKTAQITKAIESWTQNETNQR